MAEFWELIAFPEPPPQDNPEFEFARTVIIGLLYEYLHKSGHAISSEDVGQLIPADVVEADKDDDTLRCRLLLKAATDSYALPVSTAGSITVRGYIVRRVLVVLMLRLTGAIPQPLRRGSLPDTDRREHIYLKCCSNAERRT